MKLRILGLGGPAALLALAAVPASADPNDYFENRANKVADCDKKLREAARDRYKRRNYRDWDD